MYGIYMKASRGFWSRQILRNFLGPRIFWNPKFLRPRYFLILNSKFWNKNLSENKFIQTKISMNIRAQIFQTPNFVDLKFLGDQTFFAPNIFETLDQKYFLIKNRVAKRLFLSGIPIFNEKCQNHAFGEFCKSMRHESKLRLAFYLFIVFLS